MNLNAYSRKNLPSLIRAVVELGKETADVSLSIFGSCSGEVLFDLRKIIADAGAEGVVTLRGPLPNERFSEVLNDHVAFVMPTRRETFGMVFVEALFAGLPLLHTRGWGVDGFLEDDLAGYACNAEAQQDVLQGLRYLWVEQSRLKGNLNRLAETGGLDRFKRASIVADYQGILTSVLENAPGRALRQAEAC
jgi:glycosyltransferase involved in cell wall biosynthesis